ncbi:intein-containing Rv2578c family radical SAM protein [Rathayibacter sp. CAU 1779]
MRWSGQEITVEQTDALPGLAKLNNLVRSVRTPEFAGVTFHEVLAKSALNKVPGGGGALPFGWTINPYRGCQHACVYCLTPDTLILMADGRQKPLGEVTPGDVVMGTRKDGAYRRYVPSMVRAAWSIRKRAFRVTLADGTELVASGDHRFLTNRGWKYVTGATAGAGQRPYLTVNNSLQGFGSGGRHDQPSAESPEYRRGYLTGVIRGDGMLIAKDYTRKSGAINRVRYFRLALADAEALDRSRAYLLAQGIATTTRPFAVADGHRPMNAIHCNRHQAYADIQSLIDWPRLPGDEWSRGFLAGIFDAEGSCSRGVLRISNKAKDILDHTGAALERFGIPHVVEPARPNGVRCVRITGGLGVRSRFFQLVRPAITRKLDLVGTAVKTTSDLRIRSIEDLGAELEMVDITTETGDFVANGVISHNCFARPTHRYLELNMGTDFDNEIVVKVNVAEVLRKEVARASWRRHPVALGTNTDPYQRAEGRYALMPGIIEALADSGTPFSILTKGSLLRRDLDLIADAAARVPVDLAMSIAVYDEELQKSVEPGTPSTKARLETVRAVREHGLECAVFMMPILPFLTDSREHLDAALAAAKAAGASSVLYTALHLRPGVKEWFMLWLEREHPELVPKYRAMYGTQAYAPVDYRKWLAARMKPLIAKHRLRRGEEDPVTGGVRSAALAAMRDSDGNRVRFGAASAADAPGAPSRVAPEERLTLF